MMYLRLEIESAGQLAHRPFIQSASYLAEILRSWPQLLMVSSKPDHHPAHHTRRCRRTSMHSRTLTLGLFHKRTLRTYNYEHQIHQRLLPYPFRHITRTTKAQSPS